MKDFERVLKKLEKLGDKAALEKGFEKAGLLVEAEARRNAPVDAGELRRSIESRVEDKGTHFEAIIGTNLEYAPYLEYGTGIFAEEGGRRTPWSYQRDDGEWVTTVGNRPQPYLRPALDNNRKEIIEVIRASISEVIKK